MEMLLYKNYNRERYYSMSAVITLVLNSIIFIAGILGIIFDQPFLSASCLLLLSILFIWTPKKQQTDVVRTADDPDDVRPAHDDMLQTELSLRIEELSATNRLLDEEVSRLRAAQAPYMHPLYTCPLTSALPVSLDGFFDTYIKNHFDTLPKNKVRPEYHCSVPQAQTYISAAALTIICDNVIDNMLKFAPKAEAIYIRIADMEEDSLIIFKNGGDGIAEHEAKLIFDLNYQGSNKKTGCGLGLAQVKAIVTDYGGHIWAKSSHNTGFTLYIQLPEKPGLPIHS